MTTTTLAACALCGERFDPAEAPNDIETAICGRCARVLGKQGAAPCEICGVATTRKLRPRQVLTPAGQPGGAYALGTCAQCDEDFNVDRPGATLRVAYKVIGREVRDYDRANEAFDDAGVDPDVVLFDDGVHGGQRPAASKRFAHVTKEVKDALRRAYARELALRVDQPEGEGVTGGFCAACGVDHSDGWTEVQLTKHGPATLCSACTKAFHAEGDCWGPSMLERAFALHAGQPVEQLAGLRSAIEGGHEPSPAGWSWVRLVEEEEPLSQDAQIAELREQVAALQGQLALLREHDQQGEARARQGRGRGLRRRKAHADA